MTILTDGHSVVTLSTQSVTQEAAEVTKGYNLEPQAEGEGGEAGRGIGAECGAELYCQASYVISGVGLQLMHHPSSLHTWTRYQQVPVQLMCIT